MQDVVSGMPKLPREHSCVTCPLTAGSAVGEEEGAAQPPPGCGERQTLPGRVGAGTRQAGREKNGQWVL